MSIFVFTLLDSVSFAWLLFASPKAVFTLATIYWASTIDGISPLYSSRETTVVFPLSADELLIQYGWPQGALSLLLSALTTLYRVTGTSQVQQHLN